MLYGEVSNMKKVLMGLAILLLSSQCVSGAALAEADAQVNRVLGVYEKKTVYVTPEVSVSLGVC